jgi:hypothetical protein
MKKRKGIALVTTILIVSLITLFIGIALFMGSRSTFITGAEQRYTTSLQAATGGVERGYLRIMRFFGGVDPVFVDSENITLSEREVSVINNIIGVFYQAGGSIRFAAGYLGIGYGTTGSVEALVNITSVASSRKGESAQVEVLRRITLLPGG